MTGPEWVFIYYTLLPGIDEAIPWIHGENVTEAEMEFRKAAHYSLKQVWCKHRFTKDFFTETSCSN